MKIRLPLFFVLVCFIAMPVIAQRKPTMPVYDSLVKNEKVIPLQIGFIYPLGSNGIGNKDVYNRISINALAGQSKGVLGAEFSGLYSGNSGHVIGFKGTGLADLVGGSVYGFQAAGLAGLIKGNTIGMQAAGLLGANGGEFMGFQAAGLMSGNGASFTGMQTAGLVSLNRKNFKGFQAAGLVSFNGDSLEGIQAAGLVSVSKQVDGLQTAGLVNVAGYLKGVQIGLVNISDSAADDAVTIGLLNIVRKGGLLQVGLMNNEFSDAALFLKSGTKFFHGYVGIGSQLSDNDYRYSTIIGAGTSIRIANTLYLEPGWMQWLINSNGRFVFNGHTNNLQQIRLPFSKSFVSNKLFISAGPTINLLHSAYQNSSGERGLDLASHYFYNKTNRNGVNVRAWLGYTVSVSLGRN